MKVKPEEPDVGQGRLPHCKLETREQFKTVFTAARPGRILGYAKAFEPLRAFRLSAAERWIDANRLW